MIDELLYRQASILPFPRTDCHNRQRVKSTNISLRLWVYPPVQSARTIMNPERPLLIFRFLRTPRVRVESRWARLGSPRSGRPSRAHMRVVACESYAEVYKSTFTSFRLKREGRSTCAGCMHLSQCLYATAEGGARAPETPLCSFPGSAHAQCG